MARHSRSGREGGSGPGAPSAIAALRGNRRRRGQRLAIHLTISQKSLSMAYLLFPAEAGISFEHSGKGAVAEHHMGSARAVVVAFAIRQIGRASCRERVCQYG